MTLVFISQFIFHICRVKAIFWSDFLDVFLIILAVCVCSLGQPPGDLHIHILLPQKEGNPTDLEKNDASLMTYWMSCWMDGWMTGYTIDVVICNITEGL